MRSSRCIGLAITLAAAGCARDAPVVTSGDGALVLEVGGANGSLQRALVAAGVVVAPPQRRPVTSDATPSTPPSADNDHPGPESEPPAQDHVVVRLERGQTLIHLAKKHLGNGNRFREILACNGWTEQDARRLREGQQVKIPVVAGGAPR